MPLEIIRKPLLVPRITDPSGAETEAEILQIYRSQGETVDREAAIILLETPDSYLSVKAEERCKIVEISVSLGEKVSPNSVLVLVEVDAGAISPAKQKEISAQEDYKPSLSRLRKEFHDRIFLSFGHDKAAVLAVRQFCHNIDLHSVILSEAMPSGMTYFEALDTMFDDVEAAVCILTGDDVAKANNPDEGYSLRPRQNVIWEMGFFAGRLGRSKVIMLVEDGIEIPSNLSGLNPILYEENGAWKIRVATALRRAGLQFDLEGILG